jgi:predicted lactoylglutathione lyase
MKGYTTLGTNDLERASKFYDDLLSEMGGSRVMENDRMVMWGTGEDKPTVALLLPFDGEPATAGNGSMLGISCASQGEVDKVHAKALSLGAKDEGAPGNRTDAFYGGYIRDLDGNKLVFFKMG